MRRHFLLFVALAMVVPARAAVVLKSQGTLDSSFRVKTIRAKTVIEDGVATTSLVWTFADAERRWKPEVEFFYAAPPRGVVTFFAYWFKKERVVARVVEKEKATSIYNQLTAWNTDPALIELDGKNTFRARIFPVEENQDVRVEMHLVQPLESTPDGQKWVLPLRQNSLPMRRISKWIPARKSAAPFYDGVQIEVETRQKGAVNFAGARFSGGKWRFSAKNLAADRDFTLEFPKPKAPLRADLYSSRASGRDGYFSLLLTASQAMKNPRLRIAGVSTFAVFPATITALRAGENVLVCGRYRGAGAATVSLLDGAQKLSSRVQFSSRRGANNPAAKLWAARQIGALGVNEANRSRVVSLSKRWGLPSAHTSWLAVPRAEKTNFERTKREAQTHKLARQVASDLILGRAASAQKNRAALRWFYDQNQGGNPEHWLKDTIGDALENLSNDLARAHENERMEERPDAKKMAVLRSQLQKAIQANRKNGSYASRSPRKTEEYLREARQIILDQQQARLAPEYVEAVLTEGENSPRALKLKKRLDQLKTRDNSGSDAAKWIFASEFRVPLHQLAYEKMREEARLNPNPTKIAEIEADMNRLTRLSGRGDPDAWLQWQSYYARRDAIHELLDDYRAETQKAAPDEAKIAALHARIGEVSSRDVVQYGYFVDKGIPNPLEAPEIKAAQKSGDKRELLAQIDRKREFFARPGDPLIEVDAPADCLQVIAVLPSGEIKKLSFNARTRRWEARFDVPAYAPDGAYRLQILLVQKSGERRALTLGFNVDTAAPKASAHLENRGAAPFLRLECDPNTDRVSAFTPWKSRVELQRDENGTFSAPLDVPDKWRDRKLSLRFVVTDKAHNRTEILVDWN